MFRGEGDGAEEGVGEEEVVGEECGALTADEPTPTHACVPCFIPSINPPRGPTSTPACVRAFNRNPAPSLSRLD